MFLNDENENNDSNDSGNHFFPSVCIALYCTTVTRFSLQIGQGSGLAVAQLKDTSAQKKNKF